MTRRPLHRFALALGVLLLVVAVVLVIIRWTGSSDMPPDRGWPQVVPAPQEMTVTGAPLTLDHEATIQVTPDTDRAALRLLRTTLEDHGLTVTERPYAGAVDGQSFVVGGLSGLGGDLDSPDQDLATFDEPEGYALQVTEDDQVLVGGTDNAGQFYGVQTLAQLLQTSDEGATVERVMITDHPDLPLRGTVEGFYGKPWTQEERLDQLDFYGSTRLNTYIYAPKADPYHRDRWRDPYPEQRLEQLKELVQRANDRHVRFTFALSPGQSICYSRASDRARLVGKFETLYDVGVRSFSIPLDDIDYGRWNCDEDRSAYGPSSGAAAGTAQTELLNHVQREFIAQHDGARALQMVPTEYSSVGESGYKRVIRTSLAADVVIMWTGTAVLPKSITEADAAAAAKVWGRQVFIWDNYPVNDFPESSGRLLLAPYAGRDVALKKSVQGIASNPMNQSAASKIALTGVASFTWNAEGYDPERGWEWALHRMAGGDRDTARALEIFADLNRLAPTKDGAWQQQAPLLRDLSGPVLEDLDHADLDALRSYAQHLTEGADRIRTHVDDPIFVRDCEDWLAAMTAWGTALNKALDALEADRAGVKGAAAEAAEEAERWSARAEKITVSDDRNAWSDDGPARVRLGDGVLDASIRQILKHVRN